MSLQHYQLNLKCLRGYQLSWFNRTSAKKSFLSVTHLQEYKGPTKLAIFKQTLKYNIVEYIKL